jgi:hypothetical protein
MHVSSRTHQVSSQGKWWTAAAILPGQLTSAFGMFGAVVALPNIITAMGLMYSLTHLVRPSRYKGNHGARCGSAYCLSRLISRAELEETDNCRRRRYVSGG